MKRVIAMVLCDNRSSNRDVGMKAVKCTDRIQESERRKTKMRRKITQIVAVGSVWMCAGISHAGPRNIVLGDLNDTTQTIDNPDGDVRIHHINRSRISIRCRNLMIDEKADDHSVVNVEATGTVQVGQKIDQWSILHAKAGGTISIGQKIDQHAEAVLVSEHGDIVIGQKVDSSSHATLTAYEGVVTIGEGLGPDSTAEIHDRSRR